MGVDVTGGEKTLYEYYKDPERISGVHVSFLSEPEWIAFRVATCPMRDPRWIASRIDTGLSVETRNGLNLGETLN